MEGVPHPIPRTVEEVFNDFRGRRSGLIKALTTDVDKFYQQCDPEKENLCLYGLPNETWEVNLPVEEFTTGTSERPAGDMHVEDYLDWKLFWRIISGGNPWWRLSKVLFMNLKIERHYSSMVEEVEGQCACQMKAILFS
ncbi:hypothetical protein V6N11_066500 [Hibiscus sabdariffa]|uniref:PHD finger protein ALFIN-LIKE n=1 Tax=Hibiscus sabdariffa TaxID=183260 RepID=A0ABR2ACJ0_9ROSI